MKKIINSFLDYAAITHNEIIASITNALVFFLL